MKVGQVLKLVVAMVAVSFAVPAAAQSIYGGVPSPYPFPNPYATGTGSNPSSHGVEGYTTQNGTYVQPHQQTNPNNTQYDNYSTRGNVNPYTGMVGTQPLRY